MAGITAPSSPAVKIIHMGSFTGADLTGQPSYIHPSRSPDCPNMIRETAGKVRKWIGWHTVKNFQGRINGFHILNRPEGDILLVHSGTLLTDYNSGKVYRSDMADGRSTSKQLDGKLIIADGKHLLMFCEKNGAFAAERVYDNGYVPTVVIARGPSGGGKSYQPVNLMGKYRTDSFLGTASDKTYQLSATDIGNITRVEVMNPDGVFKVLDQIYYGGDLKRGRITFNVAPGESPLAGHDNIKVTYIKENPEYQKRIDSCDIMTMYGIDGLTDRIFLAGNPAFPNRDYFCQMDEPTYWPDINYSVMGADKSRIMGYTILNNTLATHLDSSDTDTTIILRKGVLEEGGRASFKTTQAYQGRGTVSRYAFAVLETEPLFLTDQGIMALTPSDVLGERYRQLRSYFLNGLLLKQDLREASACTFDRFYMLAAGGYLFALDGTQSSAEENQPYSKRQYAAFYRTNVPARVIANIGDTLVFGTEDGRVCRFYKDYASTASFNDDGAPIRAKWTTPEMDGGQFYTKKRFRRISALIGSAINTSRRIIARYDGTEELVAEYTEELKYFSFSHVSFSGMTFKTDRTAQGLRENINIKPEGKKVQFVFLNDRLNEPFALYDAAVEFTESRFNR